MKTRFSLSILIAGLLGLGGVRGQGPSMPLTGIPDRPPLTTEPDQPGSHGYGPEGKAGPPTTFSRDAAPRSESGPPPLPLVLTDYMQYLRPAGCCGPIGKDGPIHSEIFARFGVSMPYGDGILGQVLNPGFMFQGGGRSLFFDPSYTSAWTAELGISTVWYDAGVDQQALITNFTRRIPDGRGGTTTELVDLFVTPSSVNLTTVHLALGHEHYLWGTANCLEGDKCRIGWDAGGRWGTGKIVLNEIRHRTDVLGGVFAAIHSDWEKPYKCCTLQCGIRGEIGHMWTDFLGSSNDTDFYQINLLANFGIRF